MTKPTAIPKAVLKRLTKYLGYVQRLRDAQVGWVSSSELGERLGLTSSTVRQDLSHIDFYGISKRGYETEGLCKELADLLGANAMWRVVVVGAGNIGRALSLHEDFTRRGFTIAGIFDSDNAKIGMRVGNLVVRGMRDLTNVIRKGRIEIGVVAVPAQAAQNVADVLILSGVKGILNLSTSHIMAPRSVPVVDTRIAESLLELAHAIKFNRKCAKYAK